MGKMRTQYKGKYSIPKERFLTLYYYVLDRYPEWVKEYNALVDHRKSTIYGDMLGAKAGNSDPTQTTALHLAYLSRKIDEVDNCAKMASPDLWKYIIQYATTEQCSYNQLRMQKDRIPCGKNEFYAARRKFYWLLSQVVAK